MVLFAFAVAPLIITYFVLARGNGLHIGIFISIAVFWGIGINLFRVVLWNSFGKEIFTLEENGIGYVADYKYFKDGKIKLIPYNLQFETIPEEAKSSKLGRLKVFNDFNEIESVLKVKLSDIDKIKRAIKTRYNKK